MSGHGAGDGRGMGRLAPRDRRALRLGALVLVPGLLWAGAIRPYQKAWEETQDRLETERALLARERALLGAAATLPDSLRALGTDAMAARDRLVEAADPALAEATLTQALEELAAGSRVLLEEMRGIEPQRSAARPPGLDPIRLAVRGQSDLNGLAAFLRRVEESRLLLRVEELSIQPMTERPGGGQRGRGQQPEEPAAPGGVLDFALIIEAYAVPAPAEQAADGEVGP